MKKIMFLLALTFALVAGTTALVTVHPQSAYADPPNCNGC